MVSVVAREKVTGRVAAAMPLKHLLRVSDTWMKYDIESANQSIDPRIYPYMLRQKGRSEDIPLYPITNRWITGKPLETVEMIGKH
jgi:hypothetical protein